MAKPQEKAMGERVFLGGTWHHDRRRTLVHIWRDNGTDAGETICTLLDTPTGRKRAAFIVRAVNNVDRLEGALERLDKSWAQDFPDGPEWRDPKGNIIIDDEHREIWREVRQALTDLNDGGDDG